MLLDENSCFLSTVLRTHFKEEYKAVMLLDENSCFLSTVLRTNFKEGYKQQASTSRERPSQTAAAHIATLSEESLTGVGKIDSMKRNIRNAKRRALPKEPASSLPYNLNGTWMARSVSHPRCSSSST